jgi:hypothetical protein
MSTLDRRGKVLFVASFLVTLILLPILDRVGTTNAFLTVTLIFIPLVTVCFYRLLSKRFTFFQRYVAIAAIVAGLLTHLSYSVLLVAFAFTGPYVLIGFFAFGLFAALIGGLAGAYAQYRYPELSSNSRSSGPPSAVADHGR